MPTFNSVLIKKPARNVFNLSHENKLTGTFDYLYPILCEEVVPGDTWQCKSEIFARAMPMFAPLMHRVNIKTFYFFVPNRLIWDDWKDFITGGKTGKFTAVVPHLSLTDAVLQSSPYSDKGSRALVRNGSLMDYLGFPTIGNTETLGRSYDVNLLPFRAYALIWNEYFRNEFLQSEILFPKTSGNLTLDSQSPFLLQLRRKNYEQDYFTSALPNLQLGDPVPLPVSGDVDIEFKATSQPTQIRPRSSSVQLYAGGLSNGNASGPGMGANLYDDNDNLVDVDNSHQLEAYLSGVETTIADLRQAYRLQRWLENNQRTGYRYIEQILSHFGVKSSDARLQRPEFLGGGQQPMIFSEVLQNSETTTDSPLGALAGHGVSVGDTHTFKKFFEEHGWIIGVACIVPRTTYSQGIRKQFLRTNKLDYYFPEFAHLSEQEIQNKELYIKLTDTSGTPSGRFGYQQRFGEYRYIPSSVHGELRGSLAYWTLNRHFTSEPVLNSSFVESNTNGDSVFAASTSNEHCFILDIYNNIKAVRPMPKFAVPTF